MEIALYFISFTEALFVFNFVYEIDMGIIINDYGNYILRILLLFNESRRPSSVEMRCTSMRTIGTNAMRMWQDLFLLSICWFRQILRKSTIPKPCRIQQLPRDNHRI